MASTAQLTTQWKAEDDLLLKKSIEAGASLEALAKGAVHFSRRFTLQELRDRWLSLLYDPKVAEQASANMFALEYYGPNPSSKLYKVEHNCNGSKFSKKRKVENIRKRYYQVRKKFHSEFLSNSDLGFIEPNPLEFGEHAPDFQKQLTSNVNVMTRDHLAEDLGFQEEDIHILRHAYSEAVDDLAVASSTLNDAPILIENPHEYETSSWRTDQTCSAPPESATMSIEDTRRVATDEIPKINSALCTVQLSESKLPLNLSNEDETVRLEDVHEKDAGNKFHVEDSARECQPNDVSNVETMNVTDLGESSVSCTENPPVSELSVSSTQRSERLNPHPDAAGIGLKLSPSYIADELGGETMLCTLNEQVIEVPCNDDIFLLIHPSPLSPFSRHHNPSVGPIGVHEIEEELKSLGWPPELGLHVMKESLSAHPIVSCTTKPLMHGSVSQTTQAGFVNKIVGESSKGKLFYSSIDSLKEDDKNNKAANIEMQQTMEDESELCSSSSDDEDYPVDDDVPYYSDVEAMILDMDLDANNQEFDITKQVPSFKYDETKRTIVRLEQCARSCLLRAMTSKGALAVLYGRHLKYYFRKPEALLGRSTDEIDVDIDLSKEGRANKISRRQAIVKMDADGSFLLKNIGKCSVFVNGMEVASRQIKNLSSSCLIEIRDMSFVFEINQRYVSKHKK